MREDLSATTPVSATLGYAGTYRVTGHGGGTLTWLPSPGQVISQGQVLYQTDNGSPVVLLYGSVPDWRDLAEGVTGQDVSQLNHDLVRSATPSSSDIAAARLGLLLVGDRARPCRSWKSTWGSPTRPAASP